MSTQSQNDTFRPSVAVPGDPVPRAVLREFDDWGVRGLDLVRPLARFWAGEPPLRVPVEQGVDARRTTPLPRPAEQLAALPPGESWGPVGRRSVARLFAHYLIAEDPQRRLDARPVDTLAHQMSLVRHVLDSPQLRRVLIADEVGLGKTVEAGLIVQELSARRPGLRVLYLAPARLVTNVRAEFDRLGLRFRQWTAGESDARLTDPLVLASLHRAVHPRHADAVNRSGPWDVLVVDECHHLSDWAAGGGDPTERFRLVRELVAGLPADGRLVLLSGTPHQGHPARFENLLGLLRLPGEEATAAGGRVIYRTKDDVADWDGRPLFPLRRVNEPTVIDLGPQYRGWLANIHAYFRPPGDAASEAKRRAAGWRVAQAMQWAASSPQAGLGYLVRAAVRGGWTPAEPALAAALAALRPYRRGPEDEPVESLFARLHTEAARQADAADVEDIEEVDGEDGPADRAALAALLIEGVEVTRVAGDEKWQRVFENLLAPAGGEKVVLFAQPIETVTAFARFIGRRTGVRPALIVGGQSDAERAAAVDAFRRPDGPQFLVSSRAGGEGINLQVARRLVHLDVPWNPMDLEQRVGRVHRFGSQRTVLVDTVVVKESREAAAYHAARQKLRLIAATMVAEDRFEATFARVMCLVSPQELGEVIAAGATLPLVAADQERLAGLVQAGFREWSSFNERFGAEQRRVRQLDAGLAGWRDVYDLLMAHGGGVPAAGFAAARFTAVGDEVEAVSEPARVARMADGSALACGDYAGSPVFGASGEVARQAGLNRGPAPDLLRKLAFPPGAVGPAHLRWPAEAEPPPGFPLPPWGVLVTLRQSVRADPNLGWVEHGQRLDCFCVVPGEAARPVERAAKAALLRGLFDAVVRNKPEDAPDLAAAMHDQEILIVDRLRRPSDDDRVDRVSHAVTPLLAAIVAGSA